METRPTRLFLTVLPQNILVPSQHSLAFFLQENPPPFFKDMQVLWQVLWCVAGMGKVEDGIGVLFSRLLVLCLLERLRVLLLVELRRCSLDSRVICETESGMQRSFVVLRLRRRLILAVRSAYPVQAPPAPTGQREVANVQRGAAAQSGGAVAVPSGPRGCVRSFDVGGGDELPAAENTLSGTLFRGAMTTLSGPVCRAGSVGVRTGDARHPSRDALVAQRHHSGGDQRHGRRAVSGVVAGSGLRAR